MIFDGGGDVGLGQSTTALIFSGSSFTILAPNDVAQKPH